MSGDEPRILGRAEHSLSRKLIHRNALKVLYRLHRAGHRAFLVGGAVRDPLLGREPKDYDIATSARPPQVRRLFKNSRIIGRRFRLAHIYFREGIIEVATFRRDPDREAQAGGSGELLITDDNVFGTPREDAFRRDFTVNALFYDIADFSILDYVGGVEDLEKRSIRAIGEPVIRFREDPVRMMRACELAGRLGFTVEEATQKAAVECRREIEKASPARLTEEVLQLLRSQSSAGAMQWMLDLELLGVFLPEALEMVRNGGGPLMIPQALDRLVTEGREPSDIALFATLLLAWVRARRREAESEGGRPLAKRRLTHLATEAVAPFFTRFQISKARAEQVVKALTGLEELRHGEWKGADQVRFARRAFFPDALFLLEVVGLSEGLDGGLIEGWRRVAKQVPRKPKRQPPPRAAGRGRRRRRPRRRRR